MSFLFLTEIKKLHIRENQTKKVLAKLIFYNM